MKMKNLIDQNTISLLNYSFGKEIVDTYGNVAPDLNYLGESLLETLRHSTLDGLEANWNGLSTALEYLNRKLEAARKTISFWDAYQIRGTIQDRDLILSELAKLPANSAVINNTFGEVTWNGQTARQGDIFIKDYNEDLFLIKNLSSGYYAPIQIKHQEGAGNTYQIIYQYFVNDPGDGVATSSGSPISEQKKEHDLQIDIVQEQPGYNLFGEQKDSNTISFDFIEVDGTIIEPVVKYFLRPKAIGTTELWEESLIIDDVYSYKEPIVLNDITNNSGWSWTSSSKRITYSRTSFNEDYNTNITAGGSGTTYLDVIRWYFNSSWELTSDTQAPYQIAFRKNANNVAFEINFTSCPAGSVTNKETFFNNVLHQSPFKELYLLLSEAFSLNCNNLFPVFGDAYIISYEVK